MRQQMLFRNSTQSTLSPRLTSRNVAGPDVLDGYDNSYIPLGTRISRIAGLSLSCPPALNQRAILHHRAPLGAVRQMRYQISTRYHCLQPYGTSTMGWTNPFVLACLGGGVLMLILF